MVTINLAYAASADQQFYMTLQIKQGTTAAQVLMLNEVQAQLTLANTEHLGVFGKRVSTDYVLQANDRLEIYRPLTLDPMKKRRLKSKK